MDEVIQNFFRLGESIAREVNHFDEATWCVLAIISVMSGYYLLRGQTR